MGKDPSAEPLPRIAPLEPAEAIKSFVLQDGFAMQLLAAEPLVTDPVAGVYDENGRFFVVEMSDYPYTDKSTDQPNVERTTDRPIGKVRVLDDVDDDGVFDESTIFAEGSSWPTGIAVWKGGVFVAATPDLWYLKDTDGDGVADVRRQVFTGFRKFNVQAVMNNLQLGARSQDLRRRRRATAARSGTATIRERTPVDSPGTTSGSIPPRRASSALRRRPVRQHVRRLGQPVHLQHPQPGPACRPAAARIWRETRFCRRRGVLHDAAAVGRSRFEFFGSARRSPGGSSNAGGWPRRAIAHAAQRAGRRRVPDLVERRDRLPRRRLSAELRGNRLSRRGRQQPDPSRGR